MKKLMQAALLLIVAVGCASGPSQQDLEKWKEEVAATEKAFNDMAQEKGLTEAVAYFAADDGVINRRRTVLKGKEAIRAYYAETERPNETLAWAPTFVDVSLSGELAYTYGDYTFTSYDSLGNEQKRQGIFHTVWKRQLDGTWRFVWD